MAASSIPISARRDPVARIEISNEQQILSLDHRSLSAAIESVLCGEAVDEAEISLAIIDDRRMHELNARYLNHDEPTDVLSFLLDSRPGYVEGEIIVSAETAAARAGEFGWSPDNELLLYIIHGTLHLVGYDDHDPADRAIMREREKVYLERAREGSGFRVEGRPATTVESPVRNELHLSVAEPNGWKRHSEHNEQGGAVGD